MESSAVAIEAAIEAEHWWFVGRRALFRRLLERYAPDLNQAAVDVGSGTGANLRLLRDFGYRIVLGVDPSADAKRFCEEKGLGKVHLARAEALPFQDGSFDVVLATDVLEHLDDDRAGAAEVIRVLRPGGTLLVTVPAFRQLWGLQDEVSHHKRRYRLAELTEVLRHPQLEIIESYYFNYILFLPILVARQAMRLIGARPASENEVNSPLINAVLRRLFSLDVRTAGWLKLPFGVSALVLARKAAPQRCPPQGGAKA